MNWKDLLDPRGWTRSTLVDELERVVEIVDDRRRWHVTDRYALVDVLTGEHVDHLGRHVEDVSDAVVT